MAKCSIFPGAGITVHTYSQGRSAHFQLFVTSRQKKEICPRFAVTDSEANEEMLVKKTKTRCLPTGMVMVVVGGGGRNGMGGTTIENICHIVYKYMIVVQ